MILNISNTKLYQYYQELAGLFTILFLCLHCHLAQSQPTKKLCSLNSLLLILQNIFSPKCWGCGIYVNERELSKRQVVSTICLERAFHFTSKAKEQAKNATRTEAVEDHGFRDGNS